VRSWTRRPNRFAVFVVLALAAVLAASAIVSAATNKSASRARPWWSRTFEVPEVLPDPYPFCCGAYWDTLLVSTTSSGAIVADPKNPRNHVFAAQAGPNNGRDYADWSLLTQTPVVSHGFEGSSVWIRMRLYFPTSFRPTGHTAGQRNSEWNWLTMFHDKESASRCAGEDPSTVSLGIINRRRRVNPRFRLRLIGGVQSANRCTPKSLRIDGPRVRPGHWYTLVEHVVFSPSRSGLVQIWIDGRRVANVHFPTVYRHPDGSVGDYYFSFGYYRLRASWHATVLFDNVAEGPTRASISTGGKKKRG
jgi:hypothetical protein